MSLTHVSAALSRKKPLDNLGIEIYRFLFHKMGYSRHPKCVPVNYIAKAVSKKMNKDISYDQVRERMKKLVERGMVEKWTVKHPTQFRITYYRLPYDLDFVKACDIDLGIRKNWGGKRKKRSSHASNSA